MAHAIREIIRSSGILYLGEDELVHQVNLVGYKGAVWIYRFDHLGAASQTYIIKRRTRYVRMKDWFVFRWHEDKVEFVLSLVAMSLVPLWVILVMLGL